jgi:hypothetical protein
MYKLYQDNKNEILFEMLSLNNFPPMFSSITKNTNCSRNHLNGFIHMIENSKIMSHQEPDDYDECEYDRDETDDPVKPIQYVVFSPESNKGCYLRIVPTTEDAKAKEKKLREQYLQFMQKYKCD